LFPWGCKWFVKNVPPEFHKYTDDKELQHNDNFIFSVSFLFWLLVSACYFKTQGCQKKYLNKTIGVLFLNVIK
jgi:hypothetical protein